MSRQFWSFLLCGGVAALANIGARAAFSQVIAYAPAITLAYLAGMATAFLLNRIFVFPQASRPLHHQIALFALINLLAILQTLGISLLLAHVVLPRIGVTFHPELLAHIAGVVTPVLTSFIGHKYLTFSANHNRKPA